MQMNRRHSFQIAIASLLLLIFSVPIASLAQSHVVSPADLQKEVLSTSQARQHDIDTVQRFLSTPTAENAMKTAQIDPQQVRVAVSSLDSQELAQLANRAEKAQTDFSAGELSNRDLTWIILGIAVLVLIIVAVR